MCCLIEGRLYFKQKISTPSQPVVDYYQQLYASFRGTPPQSTPQLYQVSAFPLPGGVPVQLSQTIDNYLWLALAGARYRQACAAMERRGTPGDRRARR